MKSLLTEDRKFENYLIGARLSTHNNGEREVYAAVDAESGEDAVVTVFNLKSRRYSSAKGRRTPEAAVPEIAFLNNNRGCPAIAPTRGCGIVTIARHRRLAWVAQNRRKGNPLTDEIKRQGVIGLGNAIAILKAVSVVLARIDNLYNGGGHYNITTDNVIVDFDDNDKLVDVTLTGFSRMGPKANGSVEFAPEETDRRFAAPETDNGIYNRMTDIYALGMMLAMMTTGVTEADGGDFRRAFIDKVSGMFSAGLRLIVQRATNPLYLMRFSSTAKFLDILGMLAKGGLDTRTADSSLSANIVAPIAEASGSDSASEADRPGAARPKTGVADAAAATLSGAAARRGLDAVAGMNELKERLRRNFVHIVRNTDIARTYGITPANCTLLYGPQGCGKTFIAEKAAEESGLAYKLVKPSDLGSIYIHGSQAKIAETFDYAASHAPMILIFDEFDAIAPRRDSDLSAHQANEVNELLTQLNNCAERGVFVMCATNRLELLDPAVLRKGRVDEVFYVSLPDAAARRGIFEMELENRPCAPDIDFDELARVTENHTCSDIAYIVKESARRCFDLTVSSGSSQPLPITRQLLLEVAASTRRSVSESELNRYRKVREEFEHSDSSGIRPRVGFRVDTK